MISVNNRSLVRHTGAFLVCIVGGIIGVLGIVSLPLAVAVVTAGVMLDVLSSSRERRSGTGLFTN